MHRPRTPPSPTSPKTEASQRADAAPHTPAAQPADDALICGPLLNFKRISGQNTDQHWHGSVLIVVPHAFPQTSLEVKGHGRAVAPNGTALSGALPGVHDVRESRFFAGEKLYEDREKAFWRYLIKLPILDLEMRWQYRVPSLFAWTVFCIPSRFQSMRIMFHSCNGFSVGTNMDEWHGPTLWHDVLRMHNRRPFHVMLGGGDQIYNDNVRTEGPLRAWTAMNNPVSRKNSAFGEDLRLQCDQHYYDNYVRWFTTPPFRDANSSIPQVNIWDDHDIIDGFGSYVDAFMKCHVFRGIGGVAHK
jgi:hypothetical protein